MFKISKTKIKNLLIIYGKQYSDNRGYLRELLSEKEIGSRFKFAIVSKSKKIRLLGWELLLVGNVWDILCYLIS